MQLKFKNSIFILSFIFFAHVFNFTDAAQKVDVGGAGVLAWAINPKTNKVEFVLGKERSGEWSPFGGLAEKKDHNDAQRTAAREFAEESEGLFGNEDFLYNLVKKSPILSQTTSKKDNKTYINYLVKVNYISDINKLFKAQQEKSVVKGEVSEGKGEMSEVKWVSAEEFLSALNFKQNNVAGGQLRDSTFRVYSRPKVLKVLTDLTTKVGIPKVAKAKVSVAAVPPTLPPLPKPKTTSSSASLPLPPLPAMAPAKGAVKAGAWTEAHAVVAQLIRDWQKSGNFQNFKDAADDIQQGVVSDLTAKEPGTGQTLAEIAGEVYANAVMNDRDSQLDGSTRWAGLKKALGMK